MESLLGLLMALIEQIPWFAAIYIVRTVYSNKPKSTAIEIPGKIRIESKR